MSRQKPLLYNSFELTKGFEIKQFRERMHFVEIYELMDETFLLLFLRLKKQDLIGDQSQTNLIEQEINGQTYLGAIRKTYSTDLVRQLIDALTMRKGLNAVAGMEELKGVLKSDVIAPISNPEKFEKFKVSIPNGILLFGPPGCGKTYIVKKLAEEMSYNYVELKHSDVASPYIHGTVGIIGKVFDLARSKAPSIIFIDELEGLAPKREDVSSSSGHKREEVNEFLLQLNDAGKNKVLVVGATNRPDLIDTAIMRAGRMDKRIFVPPPDQEARIKLFDIFLEGRPVAEDIEFNLLAKKTEFYAASDIELIVNEAARLALLSDAEEITEKNLLEMIDRFPTSLTPEVLESYKQFLDLQRW